ncbi:MAG TPA: thioredoxin [Methanomicrobia archaeon]|nr:thioredoxin [Methanomicrobia archaeon]
MIKIIHFYADWCQDCEIQNQILDQLSMEYDDVTFELVNVDYQDNKARKYEIINIPTLVFEVGDAVITKVEGVVELEELEELIDVLYDDFDEEEYEAI